ncbi:MAG: glutathione S-transferase family protein [Exilibacterium sp.]
MAALKLIYFDIPGGRAEPARLAFKLGSIEFEDFRFPFSDFPEIRKKTPLNQVPVLEVDGKAVTQSNGICRYAARLANLYPEDVYTALLCDEIMEATEDVTHKLVATFGLEGDALLTARNELVTGPIIRLLRWAESKLSDGGGEFFIENRLTIADLKIVVWVNSLCQGNLDHIPTSLVQDTAPKLMEHRERILNIPEIKKHYQSC